MAFIRNGGFEVGQKVVLTKDVSVLSGTFQKGTIMTLSRRGERGWDLIDEEGNQLLETGLERDFFKPLTQ